MPNIKDPPSETTLRETMQRRRTRHLAVGSNIDGDSMVVAIHREAEIFRRIFLNGGHLRHIKVALGKINALFHQAANYWKCGTLSNRSAIGVKKGDSP
ncbi:MAG: hypothetical protein ACRERU_10450 [Methylococcales bacterium]